MHPTYRGLAFLLSLGSLPIACNKDDNETDATGGTGSTGPGNSTGTDAIVPTTTSVGDSTTSSASATGDDTTTIDPTTGVLDTGDTEPVVTTFLTSNTDTGETGSDTDEPPPLPEPTDPTCLAFAAHLVECMPGYAAYRTSTAQYCELYKNYGLRTDGQACLDAFEAYYVCASKVDCAEFMEGCMTEMQAVEAACPNLLEEGSTTTGIESESGTDGAESSTG